jgi:hypothetical protein
MLDPYARSIPEEIDLARWPKGKFPDESCDAVVVVLPKPLAGFGTDRQLRSLVDGLLAVGVEPQYVGGRIDDGPSPLQRPLSCIEPTSDVPSTYDACAVALTHAFGQLADRGCRHPLVLSMGYTSFGPAGARQAFHATRSQEFEAVSVVLIDSAFPDGMSEEADPSGAPATRFYAPEYRAEKGFDTHFALTSAYSYDPRVLAARLPEVRSVDVVAPPYNDEYLSSLDTAAERGRQQGFAAVPSLPLLGTLDDADLVIPIVSSDIWTPSAVGAWMRESEYRTVLTGTTTVLQALAMVAETLRRRIVVPIDASILGADLEVEVKILAADSPATGMLLLPYRDLPQAEHTAMIAASDVAVSRTGGQANAFVVSAIAGTPTLVVDLPADGYMQAELTSTFVTEEVKVDDSGRVHRRPAPDPLGYVARWDDKPEDLARLVQQMLDDSENSRTRALAARSAFESLRNDPKSNLFALIQQALAAA